MILCPQCGAKLPDWTTKCQFCQETIDPTIAGHIPGVSGKTPQWVWGAYYGIAIYWILAGAYSALFPLLESSKSDGLGFAAIIGIAVGSLSILFGIGLIARIEVIRGIINFFCGLKIIFGLLGMLGTIGLALLTGPFGIILMFLKVFDIASAAFMIYLIGETESRAPNF